MGRVQVRPAWNSRGYLPSALIALALAGCSSFGAKKDVPVDPNAYPANYRAQLVAFLRQSLTNRADFRGALISQPMLKPVGNSQHYVVCLQLRGSGMAKSKVAIYFADRISQFVDPTPEQCGDAAYAPFTELAAAMPAS